MGKESTRHNKGNSDDENWRNQRSRVASPKKVTTGSSRVSSTSSLASSSSSNARHRREGGKVSMSSSTSSSTTSVHKSASKSSQESCGSSHCRRNKRMRTKSGKKHHEEEQRKSSSSSEKLGDRRRSLTSDESRSRRTGDDNKSRHRSESKGTRADDEGSWRKRSPPAGSSSTKGAHGSSRHHTKDSRESRDMSGSGKTDQQQRHKTLDKKSVDHPIKEEATTSKLDQSVKGSEDIFDFASDIFKEGERKCAKGVKSSSASRTEVKKDARSHRLLKQTDDRRKKEYLGYQPTYVHKLYSYGIDNKGKKEPQKSGPSKKDEEMMFRKRAVYMMHLEEERKRKEKAEKEAEKRGLSKSLENNMKDVNEKLEEALKGRTSTPDLQQINETERRETMVTETTRLLQDMEAALPDDCEREAVPQSAKKGRSSEGCGWTGPDVHHFSEAMKGCSTSNKHDGGKPTNFSSGNPDPERMDTSADQTTAKINTEDAQDETGEEEIWSFENSSSSCDTSDGKKGSANINTVSNHCDDMNEVGMSTESGEGHAESRAARDDRLYESNSNDAKREGESHGRHNGLPPVISNLHQKDNGRVLAASRKEHVIRISPETVCSKIQLSMTDKEKTVNTQQLEQSDLVRECPDTLAAEIADVQEAGVKKLLTGIAECKKEMMPQKGQLDVPISRVETLHSGPHDIPGVCKKIEPGIPFETEVTIFDPSEFPASTKDISSVTHANKVDISMSSSGHTETEAKENVHQTTDPEIPLTKSNSVPRRYGTPMQLQRTDPVDILQSDAIASSHSSSTKLAPSQQYTRIAPAKTVKATPTYVLSPAPGYVQLTPQQTLIMTSSANVTPTRNVLHVIGNKNQGMIQTIENNSVCLQRQPRPIDVKGPTMQIPHGDGSVVSQVNNAACLSVPPLVVLPNNVLHGVKGQQGQNMNFVGYDFIGTQIAGRTASKSDYQRDMDRTMCLDQRRNTSSQAQKEVFMLGTDGGTQSTKLVHTETAALSSTPQGLLGYINVPVIKDDQGRLVMILPNEKGIMGSNQAKTFEVGNVSSNQTKMGSNVPMVDQVSKQVQQAFSTNVSIETSRLQQPSILRQDQDMAHTTAQLQKNARTLVPRTSLVTSNEGTSKSTIAEIRAASTSSVTSNANVSEDSKQKIDDSHGKSSSIKPKDTLEKGEECKKDHGSLNSKSVDELRVRQKAVTSKLKELRSVRVLIAKHGRMEEIECVRMVERLKQVEDLFFRQLIATSKELDDRLSNAQQGVKRDAKVVSTYNSVKGKGVRESNLTDSNMPSSGSVANKMKRSDETVDKLLNTANLLRNCINAMAKKRHGRPERINENTSIQNGELRCDAGRCQKAAEAKNKSKGNGMEERNSETLKDHETPHGSSTTTVSTDLGCDLSNGSPEGEQYHLQPPDTNAEASTEKIVLRLQRVRNREDSSSASVEGIQSKHSPHSNGIRKEVDTLLLQEKSCNSLGCYMRNVNKADSSGNFHNESNSPETNRKVNRSKKPTEVMTSESKFGCSKESSNSSGKYVTSKTCNRDDTSTGSRNEAQKGSQIEKKHAVFTGPTKEQVQEEDRREREMVKEAWNRVFPRSSVKDPCSNYIESSSSSESEQHTSCTSEKGEKLRNTGKDIHRQIKHVYGNPVIRGNLASIGNINVTRQVGGSSETKFQWLLKQLQKKRNGGSQVKQKNQLRMQMPFDTNSEDGREYVSMVSRGVQTRKSRITSNDTGIGSRKEFMTGQVKVDENKENSLPTCLSHFNHNSSSDNQNCQTKKRGRESTGSSGKPLEKLPRIRSPTLNVESKGEINQMDDIQDLISLREEVLSRQSSSSEGTVEYCDNLISVEENFRQLKPVEKEKKKFRSTGTMTAPTTGDKSFMKPSKASSSRKFATKTRGHGTYGWCKKRVVRKISKSKGKKGTKVSTAKGKVKSKVASSKKNDFVLISDDSLEGQSEEESPEKEIIPQKTRRNTLASLSARLWDECYWSTINDTSNHDVSAAKSILPSNNSPPTTRKTGLESKMLGLWSDLLRYSGNRHDVDTLPVTLEDLDKLDLPPAIASSMKILLEGYDMVKQGSSLTNEDSKSSIDPQVESILNENNSAVILQMTNNESPFEEEGRTDDKESTTDTSPSYDEESHVSSSTWEASVSTEFSLETLTSHSANTVGSGPSYHSSSTTASPPSLSTEDGYIPAEEPERNLRRWPTRMELASANYLTDAISPDISADVMNRNDPHDEGDSGRSGSERADSVAVGTSTGWQISGAGDLREPRMLTAPKATARNRRRQNRVMSWPTIIHEEEDPDDDIPLAKLIEMERLKRLQQEAVGNDHPLETLLKVANKDNNMETSPSSPESDLPGPFLLIPSRLRQISLDCPVPGTAAEDKQQDAAVSKRNDGTKGSERCETAEADGQCIDYSNDIHSRQQEEHKDMDEQRDLNMSQSSVTLKKSGKFLYGDSKKGKSLVKKQNPTSKVVVQDLSSNSSEASKPCGRRFVVSCSPDTDALSNGNHLYYRNDSSPDIFD
ncbi:uncharacterized protein LOC135154535 [Lytechinus pictus]|uniref:uncharacterized protein LOC135154535 n=1 Tax=Lytechinus pictus TaxID=7653 RepID=UPI0030B9D089